jgi:hypothetical protein
MGRRYRIEAHARRAGPLLGKPDFNAVDAPTNDEEIAPTGFRETE